MLTPSAPDAEASASRARDRVQQGLDALVRDDRLPGASATVRGRDGPVRRYSAGVSDVTTNARIPIDGRTRIGSNTKTFTATVVVQLVGEGKIDLEACARGIPVPAKALSGRRRLTTAQVTA